MTTKLSNRRRTPARRRRADQERLDTAVRVAVGLGHDPAEAEARVRAAIQEERRS